MFNLFREFTELHLTGADGVPHQLVPYLGASEIILGQGPIVFPLRLITPANVAPTTGVVGTVLTYQTPVFNGTGPIVLSTIVIVGGAPVDPITGVPITDLESDYTLDGPGPFQYTTRSAQQTLFVTTARGADGVDVSTQSPVAVITVPAPPSFSQTPSLLPAVVAAGNPVTVNSGVGPGLTWTLTFNSADVKSQVVNGTFTANVGGQLSLSSTITNAGGSVTQIVTSTITAPVTPPPDPVEELTITMSQTGFVIEDAGEAPPATITPTDDGFTVQSN